MSFYDLQFGMSVDEVKHIAEKYKHSFTIHKSDKRILYCNSTKSRWGEKNPRWDYAFIDGKLALIQFEIRQDPYVVMKKLEDTYGGYAQIQSTIRDIRRRNIEENVWRGKVNALQNEIAKKKEVPYLRIKSIDFVAETTDYDINYHMLGTGFVFPGKITYCIKGVNEEKAKIEREYKAKQKAKKQQELKKQYDELKL